MTDSTTTPISDEGVQLTERVRVYQFPGGETVELHEVRHLMVRKSGNHRIITEDGKLHIIAPGWLAVHIDDGGKGWTA